MNPVFQNKGPFPSPAKPRMPAHVRRVVDQAQAYLPGVSDAELAGAAAYFQSRADEAFQLRGLRAPGMQAGESLTNYRRRLLLNLQPYGGDELQRADFTRTDASILDVFEGRLIDEAVAKFQAPTGPLRAAAATDSAGRKITKWYGDTGECWQPFQPKVRHRLIGMKTTATGKNAPGAVVPVSMTMSDGTVRRA